MQEQEKRGPGRPRRGNGTRHIDLTLSVEVMEALGKVTGNKSKFIDDWIRRHPDIAAKLEGETMNQYWKHDTSGETYAVQVDDKEVISACGPLYYKEATQANLNTWNFNNDPELVDDLNEHREQYSLNEARYEE